MASDGITVRHVGLEVYVDGRPVETHEGLILQPGHNQDLFTVINRDSPVLVAVDLEFAIELPALDSDRVAFQDPPPRQPSGR
jgi:hypothetical protein